MALRARAGPAGARSATVVTTIERAGERAASRATTADLAVGLSVAVVLGFSEHTNGGLELIKLADPNLLADHAAPEAVLWGPLGLAVSVAVVVLLLARRLPSARIWAPAAALVLFGCWSVASTTWGGLPDDAWRALDRSVLGAAALVLGSQLASSGRRAEIMLGAVLLAAGAQAVELLAKIATGTAPASWAAAGSFGPAGYKNAQAAIFALAIPLALRLVVRQDRRLKAAGGAAAGLLLGAMLLPQSRAALVAVGVAVVVQVWWTGSRRLLIFAIALGLSTLVLDLALTRIPAGALIDSNPSRSVLLYVAVWCGVTFGLAFFAASGLVRRIAGQAIPVTAVSIVVIAAVAAAALHSDFGRALASPSTIRQDDPNVTAGSETHFASLSTNGRRDAWRVAANLIAEHPLVGTGQGGFARSWTIERRLPQLGILQPHSLELEILSELGVVGLGLFAAFGVLLIRGVSRSGHRPRAAAGFAVFVIVFGQASLDRTWSFPALDAAALLAIGAVVGAARPRRLPVAGKLAAVAAGAIAVVLLGLPYLSARQLATAAALQPADVAAAQKHAREARRLDPWSPAALSTEGRLAESAGDPGLAAKRYRAAAGYSRQPWLAYFNEARALRSAGDPAGARRACLRAVRANLGDSAYLLGGPCAYHVAGNDWPVVRAGAGTGLLRPAEGLRVHGLPGQARRRWAGGDRARRPGLQGLGLRRPGHRRAERRHGHDHGSRLDPARVGPETERLPGRARGERRAEAPDLLRLPPRRQNLQHLRPGRRTPGGAGGGPHQGGRPGGGRNAGLQHRGQGG